MQMMKGNSAVVMGAASGIGNAITRALLRLTRVDDATGR
jgi:NAD(P)-dependent dehydrogenase (short-subunit alcohol dehydrogenase family)